eukprot:gene11109-biopygen3836
MGDGRRTATLVAAAGGAPPLGPIARRKVYGAPRHVVLRTRT